MNDPQPEGQMAGYIRTRALATVGDAAAGGGGGARSSRIAGPASPDDTPYTVVS